MGRMNHCSTRRYRVSSCALRRVALGLQIEFHARNAAGLDQRRARDSPRESRSVHAAVKGSAGQKLAYVYLEDEPGDAQQSC